MFIGIYVDDMACLYKHDGPGSLWAEFTKAFFDDWQAEDEGELNDLLNIHFKFSENTVTLHQEPYIKSLVERYFPDGVPTGLCKTNQTPHEQELPQHVLDATTPGGNLTAAEVIRFQSIVGALLYCARCTRPDMLKVDSSSFSLFMI